MEHGQEPAHDEIEHPRVVALQFAVRQLAGRDDGVVVVHLGVVDDPRQRQHVEAGDVLRGGPHLGDAGESAGDALQAADLIGRQELRARPRIGDDRAGR